MNCYLHPGPLDDSLLWMKRHRASLIFKGEIDKNIVLEIKRNDQNFWDYINLNPIPDAVKSFIQAAGFGGVLDCGYLKVDHALITALVERWRPETHTFHLPIGEVTVTLEDIQVLWGLPVEGNAVTGKDRKPLRKEDCIRLCELHMGFTPTDDAFINGMIKLTELRRVIMSPLPEGAGQVEIMQRARVYLMQLLGGTVCPDASGSRMPILYINNFIDLCPSTPLSWGSAVLACMYRNLCKATDTKTKSINGPNGLLQLWAWERIKTIAPRVNRQDYNLQLAYGARWSYARSFRHTTSHVLSAFRYTLSTLIPENFVWTPYEAVLQSLPAFCTSGWRSWRCNTYLILWDIVEEYCPDRVMRQFHMLQFIPQNPRLSKEIHQRLHKGKRNKSITIDYETSLHNYIQDWNTRHRNANYETNDMFLVLTQEYNDWYSKHTVVHIEPPNPVVDGFRNLSVNLNVMQEGFHQILNSSQPQGTANQYAQYVRYNTGMHVETQYLMSDGGQNPSHLPLQEGGIFQQGSSSSSTQQSVYRPPLEVQNPTQRYENTSSINLNIFGSDIFPDNDDNFM